MNAVNPMPIAAGPMIQRSTRRVVPKPCRAVPLGLVATPRCSAAAPGGTGSPVPGGVGCGHGRAAPHVGESRRQRRRRTKDANVAHPIGHAVVRRPDWSDHLRAALCCRPVKLQELDARTLLARAGLPVPAWSVASDPSEVRAQAEAFLADGADGVVVKAQVLVGGRGKAGGVKLARTADEAVAAATGILGMDIKGITVRRVLVTPASAIVRELYLAAVLDRTSRRILLMGSGQGGVDIEELAASDPSAITTSPLIRTSASRTIARAGWRSRWA